jgi:hypothetical protein
MQRLQFDTPRLGRLVVIGLSFTLGASAAYASDHLDTPTVIADPAADIADLFAWTSSDGRRLNLIMTIVAHRFSDRIQYVFHVDSGARFGETTATTSIVCRFDAASSAECWAGDADYAHGDASKPVGLEGQKRRLRVFAGLRDDPFFNNVKGTRAAWGVAAAALKRGATVDAAGCPNFDEGTSQAIFDRWRHTDGGPPTNYLAGWTSAALAISIDLDVVNTGGNLLAVWGGTYKPGGISPGPTLGARVDRIGRPLIGNALIGPLDPDDVSDRRKEAYNRAAPADWPQFSADIQRTLGLYDGFDRACGNQWLADRRADPPRRYHLLAKVLADDRLWVNSKSTVCRQYLAVELAEFATRGSPRGDCGGRTPNYDASNVFRSLLVLGSTAGADDGVRRDDHAHSTTEFPFLAGP